jgi:protocatechuate 3,4-dioxygenase beta subunit
MSRPRTEPGLSRRAFAVHTLGLAGAATFAAACRPLGPLLASTGGAPDVPADTDPDAWATGGTASMSGDYPDPFTDAAATTCALTCAMTRGPCDAATIERRDVSEGYPGLPVRLALRVVDTACRPVAGAAVDIWHTSTAGLYSGDDTAQMCTRGDADAESHRFFRGVQTTDAAGRVDFDTIVPGWYHRRAVHIHFRVRRGAEDYVVSQLVFDDALVQAITTKHPDYAARGAPDTWNVTDSIVQDAVAEASLATTLQPDGALLAWKTIVIRASLDEPLCDHGDATG